MCEVKRAKNDNKTVIDDLGIMSEEDFIKEFGRNYL